MKVTNDFVKIASPALSICSCFSILYDKSTSEHRKTRQIKRRSVAHYSETGEIIRENTLMTFKSPAILLEIRSNNTQAVFRSANTFKSCIRSFDNKLYKV